MKIFANVDSVQCREQEAKGLDASLVINLIWESKSCPLHPYYNISENLGWLCFLMLRMWWIWSISCVRGLRTGRVFKVFIANVACGGRKVWKWNSRIIIFHIIETINFEIYRNPIFVWPVIKCWTADASSEPERICCPARFSSHSLLIPFLHLSGNCQNTPRYFVEKEIRNKKLEKDRVVLASDSIDTFLACSTAVCFETVQYTAW